MRQKILGCFRTEEGAKTCFAIQSYLQTVPKQHINLFVRLVSVFKANPSSLSLRFALGLGIGVFERRRRHRFIY